ncbi:MAG: DUF6843 domain-containing protein [Saprospiraceae bacterium]
MKQLAIKTITVIIVLIICCFLYILISFIIASYRHYPGEVFLIPDKYVGYIYIIYDDHEKGDTKWENGKLLYCIPNSGIYKTSLTIESRLYMDEHTLDFFYLDSSGNRKPIPRYDISGKTHTKLNKNSIVVSRQDPDTNWVKEDTFEGPYMVYQIDSLKNLTNWAPELSKSKVSKLE